MTIFEQLAAPFPSEAVSWRAQRLYGTKALALAYIDARDVMRRLDEVLGPDNWQDQYEETPRGRVICKLSLRVGDEWITKSDGAGDTAVEGEKGGLSDAFKRAAVKWGVGRYLYDTPTVWAPCEVRDHGGKNHWKAWTDEAQAIFARALSGIFKEEKKEDAHHGLKAEVREFVREMEACEDWDMWVAFRETKDAKRVMKECAKKLPDWWAGGPSMAKDFTPLQRRIEVLEANLAEKQAQYATQ